MAKFDPVSNTVWRCGHEALDLDWCDCSDEDRKEYNVTLPKAADLPPCQHSWGATLNPFTNKAEVFCIWCGKIEQ